MGLGSSALRLLNGFAVVALSVSVSSSATMTPTFEAPLEPDSKPMEPPVKLPDPPEFDEPPLPERFDLVCDVSWRTLNDPGITPLPWAMPWPRERNSDYQSRYVVDLPAMRYCRAEECAPLGRLRLVSWNEDLIVLENDMWGVRHVADAWDHAVIDRREATYERRITGDDGYLVRVTGICRYEPFSGFPPGPDDDS